MFNVVVIDAGIDLGVKAEHTVPVKQSADCGIRKPYYDKDDFHYQDADKERQSDDCPLPLEWF